MREYKTMAELPEHTVNPAERYQLELSDMRNKLARSQDSLTAWKAVAQSWKITAYTAIAFSMVVCAVAAVIVYVQ